MPQVFDKPLARICVRVYDEDYKYILEMAASSNVSANLIIRNIVNSYVKSLRDRERTRMDQLNQEAAK